MSKKQNNTTENREARQNGFRRERGRLELDKLTSNDISYYNKNKINFDKATAIPWVSTLGDVFQVGGITSGGAGINNYVYPGIACYSVTVGPGYANDASDPLNVALTKIMSEMYGKTSASTIPFAQADLGMLLTSTASITNLISHAKKIVDASHLWVDRNIYYPRAIFKALGIDFNDFISNQANYIVRLNELIRKFNSMYCLKFVDVYDRQYSLFRNIYTDEDSPMGQMYFFRPNNYYVYDDVNLKAANTMLTGVTTFGLLLDAIDTAINAWLSSQDLYYMNGYLNRAFQGNERLVIDEITGTEVINPVVDEVMEMQINNATILPLLPSSLDITQTPSTGVLHWTPIANISGSNFMVFKNGAPIKCYKSDPTADDNMEMTRFTVLCGDIYDSGSKADLYYCGPEIITWCKIVYYDRMTDTVKQFGFGEPVVHFAQTGSSECSILDGTGTSITATILQLAQFRVLPFIPIVSTGYVTDGAQTFNPGDVVGTLGDIYNYTLLNRKQYYDLQRTALFSLYNVINV